MRNLQKLRSNLKKIHAIEKECEKEFAKVIEPCEFKTEQYHIDKSVWYNCNHECYPVTELETVRPCNYCDCPKLR